MLSSVSSATSVLRDPHSLCKTGRVLHFMGAPRLITTQNAHVRSLKLASVRCEQPAPLLPGPSTSQASPGNLTSGHPMLTALSAASSGVLTATATEVPSTLSPPGLRGRAQDEVPASQSVQPQPQAETLPAATEESSAVQPPATAPRRLAIGAFQHIPAVSPAREILGTALRRAKLVRPSKAIVNAAKRERSRGAQQIDTLTKELAMPLGNYVRGFPRPSRLHPYEQAVLELTLGVGGYELALGGVDALRKRVLDVGKSYASLINKTTSKKDAEEQTEKSFVQLEQLFSKRGHVIDALKEVAKMLRGLPVVRHDIPTLCLVGAPNVGKSSLVRCISSGKPEVCNYPFTTRGIQMGHFFIDTRRHQVTDTPGLIARPDEERNNIELLTIAALEYLPTSVLFVHDLTEECGTSIEQQWQLYQELKGRFGDRQWIDVVSKADLLNIAVEAGQEITDPSSGDPISLDNFKKRGPPGALFVSTETQQGLDDLVKRVTSLLSQVESAEDEDLDGEGEDGEKSWDVKQLSEKAKKKKEKEDFYFPAYPGEESI